MTLYEYDIKNIQKYITCDEIKNDIYISRRDHILYYDIIQLNDTTNNTTRLKIRFINCKQFTNGLHVVVYDNMKIVNQWFINVFCVDNIKIEIYPNKIFISSRHDFDNVNDYNYDNHIIELTGNNFVNTYDVKLGTEKDDTFIDYINVFISGVERYLGIDYEFVDYRSIELFESQKVESFYNYCCNSGYDD